MKREILNTYKDLRQVWGIPAASALSMARAKFHLDEAGAEFLWEQEQDNPVDVFGDPDPVDGPFYDPEAEFLYCVVQSADGQVLDSLGMIDGAFPHPWGSSNVRNYGYLVQCEMADEAWGRLLELVTDHEPTLS